MNWLRKFMAGRYGPDQLGMFLIFFSVLLTFTARLFQISWLALVGYVPLVLCLYRMLSKNASKRGMENYHFSMLCSPVYKWYIKKKKRIKGMKTHKYFRCPKCHVLLKHPKGKGKTTITCPKCKASFIKKT